MKTKIIGIFICVLLIATAVPAVELFKAIFHSRLVGITF